MLNRLLKQKNLLPRKAQSKPWWLTDNIHPYPFVPGVGRGPGTEGVRLA